MTMKTKKTLAAVAVVLLTLCLVFVMPVGAEETGCNSAECGQEHNHVIEHAGKYYTDTSDSVKAATNAAKKSESDKTLTIIGTVTNKITLSNVYNSESGKDSDSSGIVIEGSPTGVMKGTITYDGNANLKNVVIKNLKFDTGRIGFSISGNSFENLVIENCTFSGGSGNDPAIYFIIGAADSNVPYDNLVIRNNTITNYKAGIIINGGTTADGKITIEKNIISTTGGNAIQLTGSLNPTYSVVNNEFTSTQNRPVNLAGISDGSKLTFTGNKISFPKTYNDGEFTPAIYHVKVPIVLDGSNQFYYTTNKEVALDYSSLMKHLYLDRDAAAIYVDSVKDDSGYYGGYVSVGFAKGTENPTADLTTLDIKSGYSLVKLHQNEDDGIGCHYIIGIGAESNSDMKLTAGTFAVDPTAFIADGYHVKADGSNYVVEKDEYGLSAENVGFDSVKVGYTQPDAKEVTVKNTGNLPVTLIAPVTSDKYIIGTLPTIQPGKSATFTIQPVEGLAVGNYEETITVTTAEGKEATFKVSFLVYQPSSGGSSKPVEGADHGGKRSSSIHGPCKPAGTPAGSLMEINL